MTHHETNKVKPITSTFFHEAYFQHPSSVFGGNYRFSQIHEQWARWIVSRHSPRRVIDVCCGYGYYLKAFDRLGVETTGVDVSPHALGQASAITRASLFQRDLEREPIPCGTGSMDVALLVNSLEYFRDEWRILSEIHRVLRPGGVLFFSDVNGGVLSRLLNRNVQSRILCWKIRTPQQVHTALKETRFAVIDSQPNGGPLDTLQDRFLPRFVRSLRHRLEKMMEPGYFITIEAKAI